MAKIKSTLVDKINETALIYAFVGGTAVSFMCGYHAASLDLVESESIKTNLEAIKYAMIPLALYSPLFLKQQIDFSFEEYDYRDGDHGGLPFILGLAYTIIPSLFLFVGYGLVSRCGEMFNNLFS